MQMLPERFSSSNQGEAKSLLAFHDKMFTRQLKTQGRTGSSLHQHCHCSKDNSGPQSAAILGYPSSRRYMQQLWTRWVILVLGWKKKKMLVVSVIPTPIPCSARSRAAATISCCEPRKMRRMTAASNNLTVNKSEAGITVGGNSWQKQ